MNIYKRPGIRSELWDCPSAAGQYIFEFTPGACPGMADFNVEGQEGGIKICFEAPPALPQNYDAEVTCQNIEGTFNIHVGSVTDIGNNCVFLPITSISPELHADCIVTSYIIDNEFDECDIR